MTDQMMGIEVKALNKPISEVALQKKALPIRVVDVFRENPDAEMDCSIVLKKMEDAPNTPSGVQYVRTALATSKYLTRVRHGVYRLTDSERTTSGDNTHDTLPRCAQFEHDSIWNEIKFLEEEEQLQLLDVIKKTVRNFRKMREIDSKIKELQELKRNLLLGE